VADKVHGGTPISGPNLCETCSQAIVAKGYDSRQVIHCNWMSRNMYFPVRQCSKYSNSAATDLVSMNKIAWIIESRNRGTWGFVGGKKEFQEKIEVVVRPPGKEGEIPE
jgi:hypothetical protein